jgi:hypothetical protein
MGLDYRRERIATYYRISLDELLRESARQIELAATTFRTTACGFQWVIGG